MNIKWLLCVVLAGCTFGLAKALDREFAVLSGWPKVTTL